MVSSWVETFFQFTVSDPVIHDNFTIHHQNKNILIIPEFFPQKYMSYLPT